MICTVKLKPCYCRRMSTVVVVGSGAVGMQYGSRLLEAELFGKAITSTTHFLMRSDYERVERNGWLLKSHDGDRLFSPDLIRGRIHRKTSTLPVQVDWIICALKSYSLLRHADEIKAIMDPLIGPQTRVLALMNGLDCEEAIINWYGAESVFGGMAFTCVNRVRTECATSPLTINHIAFGDLLIGHAKNDPLELIRAKSLWTNTKTKISTTDSLLKARWSKLFWNVPFSGLSVVLGGVSIDVIAADSDLRELSNLIMVELIDLANTDLIASGFDGDFDSTDVKTKMWHLTDNMGAYKTSILLDLVAGRDLEVEYIFSRVLARGRTHSHSSAVNRWPHLTTLCLQVQAVDRIAKLKRKSGFAAWTPALVNE